MAVLNIEKYGSPVLKQKAKPVLSLNNEVKKLINDMLETMYAANGVGLAANQVGSLSSIVVIDVTLGKAPPLVLINPVIRERKGKVIDMEGCLSFPGMNFKIKRDNYIKVETMDFKLRKVFIEAEGLLSRVFQHEIDHLTGKVFIERLPLIERIKVKKQLKLK